MKYIKEFLVYFSAFPAFSAKDVRLFLRKKGSNEGYHRIFMRNLVKSGRAFRIAKGWYTLRDEPILSGFAFSPFYYGLETALTYHKIWDYMTPISIITTRRVRGGERVLLGRNAVVRRVQQKAFFGYSTVEYDRDLYVPMADVEKTLIDSVYFHDSFSAEVYKGISNRVDTKKLNAYLKSYSRIVRAQVMERIEA